MGGWLAHVGIGLLFLGTVLANLVGTTGASVLLIRPVLRINRQRRHTAAGRAPSLLGDTVAHRLNQAPPELVPADSQPLSVGGAQLRIAADVGLLGF